MDLNQVGDSEARFTAWLGGVIGQAVRLRPLRDYCTAGLMLPGERKSVEPMAARTAPARTAAQHQSLLHFVGNATWSDADVLAKVREMVLPAIERSGRADRSRRGSSTTRHSPSRAFTTNIAVSSASRPTARWPCLYATLPETINFERLVDLAKLRWRIERDYQELKQEVGLGHYEGRGWLCALQPTSS